MRLRRSLPTGLAVLATLAALVMLPTPTAYADSTPATYIVKLKQGVSADATVPRLLGADAKVIHRVFQGGIVRLNAVQARALASSPSVESVRQDVAVRAETTQTPAPWATDILDSQTGAVDNTYTSPNDGAGVTVYVIDSGIYRSQSEFSGVTIATGYDFVPNDSTSGDCAGHGTAVSSLIAGATLGASKAVTLVPLKVLDCTGSGAESSVIQAADWIASNRAPGAPAVANLSFGVQTALLNGDTTLNTALQGLLNSGVTLVAAAGNDNINACGETPASLPGAITVASMALSLVESSFSNYGSCVDLYAPGEYVTVAGIATPTTKLTGSGTSFSAPLTTGAVAQVLHDHPTWSPAQVSADLVARADNGLISGPAGVPARSPNRLLNVTDRFGGTAPTISGAVKAGDTATAVLHWTPTPTSVSYQWYRNGAPIVGATGSTYVTSSSDVGASVTVTATGTTPGYLPVSGTSAALQLGLPSSVAVPTTSGSPAVSYTLTAVPGPSSPVDLALSYQWSRDGVALSSATAATYAPVAGDVGHTLTVTVTGSKAGYRSSTAVSAPTAVIQSATSPLAYQAFVKASSRDFLGRQPTVDELSSRSAALSSGTLSRATYLSNLTKSDEWLSAIVTKMYADTLNRTPDPAGLAYWVGLLRGGTYSVATVASLFYSSDEYFQIQALGSNTRWVSLLYQQLLNRTADPSGLQFWVANTGTYGRDWVAYNFYQSQESRSRRVEALYQTLLFREPDPTGWAFWTDRVLTTGDLTLASEIASSDEYWAKAHLRY